jgi:hypothetical protein
MILTASPSHNVLIPSQISVSGIVTWIRPALFKTRYDRLAAFDCLCTTPTPRIECQTALVHLRQAADPLGLLKSRRSSIASTDLPKPSPAHPKMSGAHHSRPCYLFHHLTLD